MKNLVKGFLMLTLVVLMASCADKNKLIAKTWVIDLTEGKAATATKDKKKKKKKSLLGKALDKGKEFTNSLATNLISFEFKSDGTFNGGVPFLNMGGKAGKWKIEGNTLKLTVSGETKDINIVKLTSKQLVLGADDGKKTYLMPQEKK